MPGKLTEGIPTTLSIGQGGMVCEIELTPPEIDGGELIPQDCMRSGVWGIALPRYRKRLMPFTAVVSWDPLVYGVNFVVVASVMRVNFNQTMSVVFPDGRSIQFYASVTKFTPGVLKEGERPTATVTIAPTLMNTATTPPAPAAPTYYG